jgi:hypothetical protein
MTDPKILIPVILIGAAVVIFAVRRGSRVEDLFLALKGQRADVVSLGNSPVLVRQDVSQRSIFVLTHTTANKDEKIVSYRVCAEPPPDVS